jgi:Flp pilus assembly protein TadD
VASTAAPAPTPVATVAPPAEPTSEQHKANAKAAIDAKDWAKAKSELQAVVAKDPNDVEAHKLLGQVAEAQNDAAGATDAYVAAAKADGGKDEVLALAAAAGLYAQRRYDDLASLMQMVTKNNAKSQPGWIYLALAQEGKEDWAGASETWGKLTQSWPDEPKLWAGLAAAQGAAGKADDAKKSAKSALDAWKAARDPKAKKDVTLGKGADEIATIARAYRRAGDPKGASAALDRYPVPKDETAPLLDVERGFAKLAQKDTKGAATLADKATKAGGDNFAPAHLLAAGVAAASKKPDEAKTHLAAYDKLANPPSRFAWERKWIDTLVAGGAAEAPKAPAAPAKSGPAPSKQGGAGKK